MTSVLAEQGPQQVSLETGAGAVASSQGWTKGAAPHESSHPPRDLLHLFKGGAGTGKGEACQGHCQEVDSLLLPLRWPSKPLSKPICPDKMAHSNYHKDDSLSSQMGPRVGAEIKFQKCQAATSRSPTGRGRAQATLLL